MSTRDTWKLIPWPRDIRATDGLFIWRAGDRLLLAPESGGGDAEALTALAAEMAQAGIPRPLLDRRGPDFTATSWARRSRGHRAH